MQMRDEAPFTLLVSVPAIDESPLHLLTGLCTEGCASDEEEIVSAQSDPRKQLCPLILHTASKYPVDGVKQLPRNSNECLQTGFVSSQEAFKKKLLRGDRNGMRPTPACKALFSDDDFPHG
jgi:hypothetical protein